MTVSGTTTRITYSGDGSTTVFAYTFKIWAATDLVVILRNTTTYAESLQTNGVDYTVSGAGDAGGGNVTFTAAPAATEEVHIIRQLPLTQLTDYVAGGDFQAASHENALDRLIMVAQQLKEMLDRALILPDSSSLSELELPEPTAGPRYLRWNAAVDEIEAVELSTTALSVTAFAETLLDDANAKTARATLGVEAVSGWYRDLRAYNNASNPNYQLDITAAELMLVNFTTGEYYKATDVAETVDITVSGAGGLEAGSEDSSKWYHIFIIYNPTTGDLNSLLVREAKLDDITMPSGYTFRAYVGSIFNNASSNFIQYYQANNVVTIDRTDALSAGSSATGAAVDLSDIVPETAIAAFGEYLVESNGSAGGFGEIFFRDPNGNDMAEIRCGDVLHTGGNAQARGFWEQMCVDQEIRYQVSDGDLDMTIRVSGWRY